jgi:hypothetical protein
MMVLTHRIPELEIFLMERFEGRSRQLPSSSLPNRPQGLYVVEAIIELLYDGMSKI